MKKRFQVFVSSTYIDLIEERKKVANAISKANQIPVGMELFPASTIRQWEKIKELIDTSDYYVLIIGKRYGSIAPILDGEQKREISYTQKEYEYAYNKGVPILTFFLENSVILPDEKTEKLEKYKKKLESFIRSVKNNGYYYEHWENSDELSRKVLNALNQEIQNTPRPGWIRSDNLIEFAKDYNSTTAIKEKIIYYKFLHLSEKSHSSTPIYKKFIPRISSFIDVYDEYITFRVTKFVDTTKNFVSYDRTSGSVVDVVSLFPFNLKLSDTDKKAAKNPNNFQPIINGVSDVYITSSNYYNGFQPGNKDLGVKADKDTAKIRIVADFTSIYEYEKFIGKNPQVFYRCCEKENDSPVDKKIGDALVIAPGVFYAEIENIKANEALRIEFGDDIETMSNYS